MPETPLPCTPGRVLGGRYRLLASIARGGMAEVWEGHDDVLDRPVAVKILHAHLAGDDGFVERFRREAVAAARLAHPDIVATFDAGTDGSIAYIVMELVRGRTLRQAMETDGPFPAQRVVDIGTRVAEALDHAHRSGIVHRDIKPANILLASDGPAVKVADFGIAKLQGGGDLTQTGAIVGTAKYLAPEQVEGHSPDVRSDVYALGVVCYEMLCGRPPFEKDTELATALAHVRAEVVLPHAHRVDIPGSLETVVMKAMARDPERRYQSAADLRVALSTANLADGPADDGEDTPPAGVVPVRRASRRWRPAVLVLALVGLVAAVVISQLPGVSSTGGRGLSAPAVRATTPLAVAEAHSFDPQGDQVENEARARLAVDGDPATSWATDRYSTRQFGRLKSGVGLVVRLSSAAALGRLVTTSPTSGWAASVYVADAPMTSLEAWGKPVDTRSGLAPGTNDFDLHGRRGGAVLLWITDPGTANKTEIAEVVIQA